MKILHVCHNYFPSPGGPQYTMKHLSEKLVANYGDEVEVVTTNSYYGPESTLFQKISPASETLNGVSIQRKPLIRWHYPLIKYGGKVVAKLFKRSLPYHITKLRWGLHSPAIKKAMELSTADVVMATTINYLFCDYPSLRFKTKNPKPFVLYGAMHLHRELPENDIGIIRAKACDCYISNTEFETRKLMDYGVSPDKIVTIGTGIELKDFKYLPSELEAFKTKYFINKDDVVIGYVGRLVKGKGVSILLDAFRKLYVNNKKIKLLLAGSTTDYVPEIKKIIQQESLPVILIENFENELKPLLFNALDIFVLASQSESFGVVFLEAWACKKPVVATSMGAIASLLSENIDSFLFPAGDLNCLILKLDQLINDAALRRGLGEKGFEKVLANYTWEKIIQKYRNAYLKGIENFKIEYGHKL